jgi:hypothetical protein
LNHNCSGTKEQEKAVGEEEPPAHPFRENYACETFAAFDAGDERQQPAEKQHQDII